MKSRSPHGLKLLLLAVFVVLGGVFNSRADALVTDDINVITNGGRITFATNGTFFVTAPIVIRTNTQIDGGDLTNIVISGSNFSRIFYVTNKVTLTLTNIQLTAGKTSQGAAIYNNYGTVIASNVLFTGNNATNKPGVNGGNGSGGNIAGGNGIQGTAGYGGAIYNNFGSLLLTNCIFTNNVALGGNGGNGGNGYNSLGGDGGGGANGGVGFGGAIYNNGTNVLLGCYFVANTAFAGSGGTGGNGGSGPVPGDTGPGGVGATAAGGGIYNAANARTYVTNCSFVANQSLGGDTAPQGITYNGISSTGQNGGAAFGAGIHNAGILNLENCTFFTNVCQGGTGGNTLGDPNASAGTGGTGAGGAVANAGTFFALNCTFATNSVFGGAPGSSPFSNRNGSRGAALGSNLYRSAGTSKIQNCLLQHGAGADNAGALTDGGHNLSSDTSCAFTATSSSISKTNALLVEKIAFFPGVVPPLLPFKANSPAQDKIAPVPADNPTNFPATDERGFPRGGTNGNADIGSFEFAPTPPIIIVQPQDQVVKSNTTATFTVSATGEAPLNYQWTFIGTNGSITNFGFSTNNSTLVISNAQSTNLGTYFVVITNGLGFITSSNATLSFMVPPAIVSQTPADVTVPAGGAVTFAVTTTGNSLDYRWFFTNSLLSDVAGHIEGSETPSLTITNVVRSDRGAYKITVSNALGTASANFNLTVSDPGIVTQPADVTTNYGSAAVFSVVVASSTNVSYQWKRGTNTTITGATRSSYTNTSAIANETYFVVVSNVFGVVTSQVAHLTVNNPGISTQPTNLVRDVGTPATFNVVASGTGGLSYQWKFNGAPIPTGTTNTYTIPSVTTSDAGSYTVTVSNPTNSITSSVALLVVQGSSTISGRITFGTNGVGGIIVSNGVTNVISASDGSYSFAHLLAGPYTITPVQIGSGLLPVSTNVVTDGSTPISNVNFAFNGPLLQITNVPTNAIVALHILSAPNQQARIESSTNLINWTNVYSFTVATNGKWDVTVTNTSADPALFLRAVAP